MRKTNFSTIMFWVATLTLLPLSSCKKEVITNPEQSNQVPTEYLDFLGCQGFETEGAVHSDPYIQIENDIVLSVDDLEALLFGNVGVSNDPDHIQSRQHALVETTLMTMSNAAAIKVYIHPSVGQIQPGGADWVNAIYTALSNWEAVNQCRIDFSSVSSSTEADLIFYADNNAALPTALRNLGSATAAAACFPSAGKIGKYVSINDNGPSASIEVKRKVMRHEIGHTFGLRHNNAPGQGEALSGNNPCGGIFIGMNLLQGTPVNDPLSVMQQGALSLQLSNDDKKAVQLMYPDAYNVPTVLSTSIQSCGSCGSSNRFVNFNVNQPTQNPYRVLVERFSLSGTSPLQSVYIENPGAQTTFKITCPTGSWRFKVSRLNYGSYKVSSAFVTVNVQ